MSINHLSPYEVAAAAAKSFQSCLTLCDPIDGSPPGSPVPGILQARTLEWVAISCSNAWQWKVKVKSLSRVRLFMTLWTAAHQAPPSMGFSRQEHWSGVPSPSPPYELIAQLLLVSHLHPHNLFLSYLETVPPSFTPLIHSSLHPLLRQPLFCSLWLECVSVLLSLTCFLCNCTYRWSHAVSSFLFLTFLTLHDILQAHPMLLLMARFPCVYGWAIVHCVCLSMSS